jgi:predicted component of viral defense system (DUF524 family)
LRPLSQCTIPFYGATGQRIAELVLIPFREATDPARAPLVEREPSDAGSYNETEFQLREGERYEYIVESESNLRLRSSLSTHSRTRTAAGISDAGILETGNYCGTLLLELVTSGAKVEDTAVSLQTIDVRSVKLDYRTQYRGMLKRVSEEAAALLVDARSSVTSPFRSTYASVSAGDLQLQFELLRHIVDDPEFKAAVHRIVECPHETLNSAVEQVSASRCRRLTPQASRLLVQGSPRAAVGVDHPVYLRAGLKSVARTIPVVRRERTVDTAENRFVKFALTDMRAFLAHAQTVFSQSHKRWGPTAHICVRLSSTISEFLNQSFFSEVGALNHSAIGSPVLQQRGGYREVLSAWLRFRSASELSWPAGKDVFRAGQRNVALLYEYWIFFILLDLFCRMFRNGERPDPQALIDRSIEDAPQLRLKEGEEIGPFEGTFVHAGRVMRAKFAYNRAYAVSSDRSNAGSWTRRLRPDYSLSFWPAGFAESEAEARELLVHVHFDAKYRVEGISDLFGAENELGEATGAGAKYRYQDLLKMHAYRDAIRRTQGAFILYPGSEGAQHTFRGFTHEILPGVGAFALTPDESGRAKGIQEFESFLVQLLEHLTNRTTAQERVSFHVGEAYRVREGPVIYGDIPLQERDELSDVGRALPPDEHTVIVAWFDSPAQIEWTQRTGLVVVRLGDRPGTWHVPPEVSSARHILLRTHGNAIAPGLRKLTRPGYNVFSASDLVKKGYPGRAAGDIYAVFSTAADPAFASCVWDGMSIRDLLLEFEMRRSYRWKSLGRRSPDPRVLSLRTLLKAVLAGHPSVSFLIDDEAH